jgi:hypothetical protein
MIHAQQLTNSIRTCIVLLLFAIPLLFSQSALAEDPTVVTRSAQVQTANAGLTSKLAPGEILPVSVSLANFGGGTQIDVLVHYDISTKDASKTIVSTDETVVVATTNTFVKTIQIPFEAPSGIYTVKASATYKGQTVPATTSFDIEIEPKILGVFRGTLFVYGGISLLAMVGVICIIYALLRRSYSPRSTRSGVIDYSDIPKNQRVFYELISDTVMNMRQQVGQEALNIATAIDGLEIDEYSGRVIRLSGRPSKIIADLVSGYERSLGKKVNFIFRQETSGEK